MFWLVSVYVPYCMFMCYNCSTFRFYRWLLPRTMPWVKGFFYFKLIIYIYNKTNTNTHTHTQCMKIVNQQVNKFFDHKHNGIQRITKAFKQQRNVSFALSRQFLIELLCSLCGLELHNWNPVAFLMNFGRIEICQSISIELRHIFI